jgi:putative transposase
MSHAITRGTKSNGKSNGKLSQPAKGRRFTEDQKKAARKLVRAGAMPRTAIAQLLGTTVESLRRWVQEDEPSSPPQRASTKTEKEEPSEPSDPPAALRSPYSPRDPGQGLAAHEVEAIIEQKKQHPSMGPAQIRAQLKRFKGWRVSNRAIARVLKQHGFERVHRGSRPQGPEPIRFEAPRRNALWQLDFAEVRVHAERLHVLVIIDDFSRYVVGHALGDSPSTEVATETLRRAIARHGKPEAVRSDRGGAFVAFSKDTDFGRFLDAELIDHIVGQPYHPQGGGKVERAIGTLRRELWDVCEFADRRDAEQKLAEFFERYNEARAHMGIDGLTPADRYFGRADRVLARVDAISRKRQGALAVTAPAGASLDDGADGAAPMEVLRLVLVDGVMELRFCGARVRLGPVES